MFALRMEENTIKYVTNIIGVEIIMNIIIKIHTHIG